VGTDFRFAVEHCDQPLVERGVAKAPVPLRELRMRAYCAFAEKRAIQ
jgi:hypothetical protein